MGYFSRLDSSVQIGEVPPPPVSREIKSNPVPVQPTAEAPAAPAAKSVTTPKPNVAATPAATPASTEEKASAPVVVKLDAPSPIDDTAARQAHEAAEAKRKAEWEAKQAAKKAARQEQLDRIKAMNDADLLAASVGRVASDTEKLTRRNMKEAVAEHIQAKCREDTAFALLVMDPDKSMINCFKYINRRAQAYAEQEMKDNGIDRTGVYGLDVPDGLCFQWAVDYFNDPDAKEDHADEEKFVPKPYIPTSSASKSAKPKVKKEALKTAAPKPKPQPKVDGQLSFMEAAG